MTDTTRHPDGTKLTVEQVSSMTRLETTDVLKAIQSKQLRAAQARGQWEINVEDMRRWLSRR